LPIIFQERVYGWLCLNRQACADEFSDQDEQIAVTLARQMASAYDKARLYSETRHHGVELEREVAERKRVEEDLRAKNEELAAMTQQFWQGFKAGLRSVKLAAERRHELNKSAGDDILAHRKSARRGLLKATLSGGHWRSLARETERMGNLVSNLLQFSRRDQRQLSTNRHT